ncbi:MAG: DUF2849 domain-containing protein [Rhodospirillales bacterium]|nr:DUF2849 domain-containing protein [Rhodospirillales bacterium]
MKEQVVTANRLADGRVVYLAGSGDWSSRIGDSQVAADPDTAAQIMATADAAAAQQIVVEPYLIPVVTENGLVRPIRYRERIRAGGPSVQPASSAQAKDAAPGGHRVSI